ncbi:MAG: fibronectin type III domain-containing protein [Saccharospirillum sp.]|nr:fibronectin type III domain-containing protein [Saccharospirillum sp.]
MHPKAVKKVRTIATLLALAPLMFILSGCDLDLVGMGGSAETGSVSLYWSEPMERVNGDKLEPGEITGYVIRYRDSADARYQTVYIENGLTFQYHFEKISNPRNVVFQVAAVDKNGIFSDFITAQP